MLRSPRRARSLTALALGGLLGLATLPANAGALDASSTRALGMGGAVRGAAAGSEAPFANPSGLSILREYVIDAGYQYTPDEAAHVVHVVAADNRTSWLGAAPAYTFARSAPENAGGTTFRRHELGLTLSATILGRLMVGATGKYLWTRQETPAGPLPLDMAVVTEKNGLTYDVGITIQASPVLHLGAVGYNLRDLKSPHAPRGVGGGIALAPFPQLAAAADVVTVFTTLDGRSNVTSFMGGAEYHLLDWLALRAGGGYDGLRDGGYASGGVSLLSVERGGADVTGAALDVGLRRDVSGKAQATYLGVSLRLFIPVAEAP